MFDETSAHFMNSICVPVWRHSAQYCPGSRWKGGVNQYVVSKLRKGKDTVGDFFFQRQERKSYGQYNGDKM